MTVHHKAVADRLAASVATVGKQAWLSPTDRNKGMGLLARDASYAHVLERVESITLDS